MGYRLKSEEIGEHFKIWKLMYLRERTGDDVGDCAICALTVEYHMLHLGYIRNVYY